MAKFTAAAIQMRSGVDPEANVAFLREAVAEAAAGGARYVQTPEMTGAVQRDRKALFAVLREEQSDPVVRAAAELAAAHGVVLHIGSTPISVGDGQDRQPGLRLRCRRIARLPLRQDAHVRRRSRQRRKLARKRGLPAGRGGRRGRTSAGVVRCRHLLRSEVSRALSPAGARRRRGADGAGRLHPPDRRSPLACAPARPRDREWRVRRRGGARRSSRGRARDIRPFDHRRSLGRRACRCRRTTSPAS